MKNNILIAMLIVFTLFFGVQGKAQFTFSVSPGFHLNGASFGYQMGNLITYGGLQIIGGAYTETETGKEFDKNGNLQSYTKKYTVNESLFVPSLGARFFFKKVGKLKMYGDGVFAYFIPSVKITDSENPSANSEFKDQFEKVHIFGGQLGFGTEYFFDNNFSVGGEFGLMLLNGGYEEKQDNFVYNPITGEYVNTDCFYNYKINLTPTFIKISFNFYFAGEKE